MNKNAFYRGFETSYSELLMSWRMITTVISITLMTHFFLWFFIIFMWLDVFEYHIIFTYIKAAIFPKEYILYFTANDKQIPMYAFQAYDYLTDVIVPQTELVSKFWKSIGFSFLIYLFLPFLFRFFKKRSEDHNTKEWIRGSKLISTKELKEDLEGEATDLPFGNVKLPKQFECQHVFFIGSPGSGKTVFLNQVIERTIQRKENCVIYDFKGDFVSKFFRPGKDILFNPLDRRCVGWNIFNELGSEYDIDAVAASLIPPASGDSVFWNDGARDVFSAILIYLFQQGKTTNADVWEAVTMDIRNLSKILGETKGAERGYAYIQDGSSKQAVSVHSVLMQYAKSFQYLKDLEGDFSIQKWIKEPKGNIFIPNYANTKDTLKPILSLFVDLLGRQLLSLPDDINRRIFFFEDEFGSLQRMSTIINLLTLGRSKGASIWLGIQDVGQLEKIYGRESRQTIINACGTSVILRVSDPTTSKYLSDKIGQCVINVPQESFSMGVTDFRDGVNLSKVEKTEPLILPSELQNLPDLTAFVKFVGHDLVKVKLKYKAFKNKNTAFEERQGYTLNQQYTGDPRIKVDGKAVLGFKKKLAEMKKVLAVEVGIDQETDELKRDNPEILFDQENDQSGAITDQEFDELKLENPEAETLLKKKNIDIELDQDEVVKDEQEKAEIEKNSLIQGGLLQAVEESPGIDIDEIA
jgi:type IV conjugative transfer system coupling protein TraD